MGATMIERPHTSLVEWAVAGVPLRAGTESGDLHVVAAFDGGVLVGAIDGLGHGPDAAEAARVAADVLQEHAAEPPARLLGRCHDALRSTRGAVLTLASIDGRRGSMTWAGVGNVEGMLLRIDPAAPHESAPLRGGIVGLRLPPCRESTITVVPADILVLTTDGILHGASGGLDRSASAASIAEAVLAAHRNPSDDALVVVARYVGPRS